jgi:hypothetical protein
MAGGDMPELASDQESEFSLVQMIDVLTRKYERVRIAHADRGDRHEEIVANEDLWRRYVEFGRDRTDEPIDLRKLPAIDADARTQ